MNEERIREALKIIKKPITVNSVNYKYFDEVNYDKLITVYDNCLWFANNLEQINSTLEQLKKENSQLKDNWNKLKEIIKKKFVAQGGFTSCEWNDLLNELLDKMQELGQGKDENN